MPRTIEVRQTSRRPGAARSPREKAHSQEERSATVADGAFYLEREWAEREAMEKERRKKEMWWWWWGVFLSNKSVLPPKLAMKQAARGAKAGKWGGALH